METYYKGKHIVKYMVIGETRVEIYVEFESGKVCFRTYIDGECVGTINVADLKEQR